MRHLASLVMVACLGTLPGCFIVEPNDGDGANGDRSYYPPNGEDTSIDAEPLGEESTLGLPRLTRDEYLTTLADLLAEAVPSLAGELLTLIEPATRALPADQLIGPVGERHGGFARLDQSQQQQYANVPVDVAALLGRELVKTAERQQALLGTCASGGSFDRSCVEAFVQRFGALALRRPLAAEDVDFYLHDLPAQGISAEQVGNLVTQLLSAPRFLYHVESGTEAAGADDIFALDAWELASRLSYHFWGTMPDAALRAKAESGALLDPATYEAEVSRMFQDQRADRMIESFFAQWFWPLLDLPALDSRSGDPVFRAFAGRNMPTDKLRDNMVREVIDAVTYVAKNGGTLRDLMTNNQSFAKDSELAGLYGVPVWDGVGPPPTLPPERVGLLTRAAFLTTGSANTRPVMKGVFIRTTLLCEDLPPPPPEAMAVAINLSPELSTRQVVEQLTETSGSCPGCHKSSINPFGYVTENFDSLGRVRTTQTLFNEQGEVTGQAPINTRAFPRIDANDREVNGAGELTERLLESGKIEGCFARRYFRFTFRRLESTSGDRTLINVLTRAASDGGTLADMLRSTALRPEFRRKRFPK